MKNRNIFLTTIGVIVLMLSTGYVTLSRTKKISVLIITGGHDFEHGPFYAVFDALPNVHYDTLAQPQANALIATSEIDKYDVLVFYDMFDSILPTEQQAYVDLLKKGKAMIFLHHSLVSYQNWGEFIHVVGGKYHTRPVVVKGDTLKGNYEHDVTMPIRIEDKKHPVTAGINDFDIVDEIYGDTEILPTVKPLLSTSLTKSMRYLAWINHYGNSDVLYIQLGHGPTAYANPNYRKLLQQAIEWSYTRHAGSSKK